MADDFHALQSVISQLLESDEKTGAREYNAQILQRIAEENNVKPSRIPAPLNITEVGGYFNLIEQIDTDDPALKEQKARMQLALIASALGLPI